MSRKDHFVALRELNEEKLKLKLSFDDDIEDDPDGIVRDNSFKKNTAFVKRCRVGILKDQVAIFQKEVDTLSLVKYLSEIISAFSEGLSQVRSSANILAAVDIAGIMHRRFGKRFSVPLMVNLLWGISPPTESERQLLGTEKVIAEMSARHRTVLSLLYEMSLSGMFDTISFAVANGVNVPKYSTELKDKSGHTLAPELAATKAIIIYDTENGFPNHAVLLKMLNNYRPYYIAPSFVSPTDCSEFGSMFNNYMLKLIRYLTTTAKELTTLDKFNERQELRTGLKVASEDKRPALLAQFENLLETANAMSKILDIPVPPMTTSISDQQSMSVSVANLDKKDDGDYGPIWEDREQYVFYTDNDLGLENLAPDENENEVEKTESAEIKGSSELSKDTPSSTKGKENARNSSTLTVSEEFNELKVYQFDDEAEDDEWDLAEFESTKEEPIELSAAGKRAAHVLELLRDSPSVENINKAAIEFAHIRNRATENKVASFLKTVVVPDQYKLPFYSKFIATILPIAPRVLEIVLEFISDFFIYLQRKIKIPALNSRRTYALRYISELTKFGIVPNYQIFHKFRTVLVRMGAPGGANVECMAELLEGCGRYLINTPSTKRLMNYILNLLKEKRKEIYLTANQRGRLDNAMLYVFPPAKAAVYVKERSNIEQYIRHLFYSQKGQVDARILLKFNWNDKDTQHSLLKVFVKIHKIDFDRISVIANLVQELSQYYPWFSVQVVDSLMENIRQGLERPSFKNNQRRLSEVFYLGSLFNCGVVDVQLIFDTLYQLLRFGHPQGRPSPGAVLEIDLPNDFFRIRLAITLLDAISCAELPEQPINVYLAFLQYYIFCKETLPMDLEFSTKAVYNKLRPGYKMSTSLISARERFERALRGEFTSNDDGQYTERETENQLAKLEQEEERKALQRDRQEKREQVRLAMANVRAQNEFDANFQMLMKERNESSQTTTMATRFDVSLPNTTRDREAVKANKKNVAYTVLKKGGTSQLNVPVNAKFVEIVTRQREQIKQERDKIVELTLKLEHQQRNDDEGGSDLKRIIQPALDRMHYSRKPSTARRL